MRAYLAAVSIAAFTPILLDTGCCETDPVPEPTHDCASSSSGNTPPPEPTTPPASQVDSGCVPQLWSYWSDGANACQTCACQGQICWVGTVDHDGHIKMSDAQGICDEDLNCSLKCPSYFEPPWCRNGVQDHGETGVDCGDVAGCKPCP